MFCAITSLRKAANSLLTYISLSRNTANYMFCFIALFRK